MQKRIVVLPDQVSPSVLREACLVPDQRSAVLDPKIQGAPVSLGDGFRRVALDAIAIRPIVKNAGKAGYANTIGIVGFANYARHPRFALIAFRSQGVLCAHTGCNLYETVN